MKLLLLTCLVALTLAAPSERTKSKIFPRDVRYDGVHESHHEVHAHHENEVEIARALSSNSGCLSPLGLAKGYGVQELKQETQVGSTNLLAHDVETAGKAVIESSGSETSGVDKAVEQPASISESSPTLLKQEPVSYVKSVSVPATNAAAFTETVDVAARTQGTAAVAELAKSDDKDSTLVVEANLESRSADEAKEASSDIIAQNPESIKPEDKGSLLEEGTKAETELAKSDDKDSTLVVGTNLESNSANEAQEASSGTIAQNPESIKPEDKDSLREEGTKAETESATGEQKASSGVFVQNPELVEPNIENSNYNDKTTHEAKSTIHAEQHANVQEVSSDNFESHTQLVKSQVLDSQPDPSEDIASHSQNDGEANIVSSDPNQSAIVAPANDAESSVEARPSDANAATDRSATPFEPSLRSSSGSGFNAGFGSPISSFFSQSPSEAPSSDADSATVSSATPFESKFRSSFGSAFNSGYSSPNSPTVPSSSSKSTSSHVDPTAGSSATPFESKFGPASGSSFNSGFSHSFPPAPISAVPSYNSGYSTYDHSRYNPNIHPGYGYTPGFSGYNAHYGQYNNNYGRLGYNGANYYPGHPFGVGIHSGYDQDVKGQNIINPQVPFGFSHSYPVDYTKNVPYVQPPSFQFRTSYPTPQPVPSYPSIQQSGEQSSGVEASQAQEQLQKNYQSPDSLVQPTAASLQD